MIVQVYIYLCVCIYIYISLHLQISFFPIVTIGNSWIVHPLCVAQQMSQRDPMFAQAGSCGFLLKNPWNICRKARFSEVFLGFRRVSKCLFPFNQDWDENRIHIDHLILAIFCCELQGGFWHVLTHGPIYFILRGQVSVILSIFVAWLSWGFPSHFSVGDWSGWCLQGCFMSLSTWGTSQALGPLRALAILETKQDMNCFFEVSRSPLIAWCNHAWLMSLIQDYATFDGS